MHRECLSECVLGDVDVVFDQFGVPNDYFDGLNPPIVPASVVKTTFAMG